MRVGEFFEEELCSLNGHTRAWTQVLNLRRYLDLSPKMTIMTFSWASTPHRDGHGSPNVPKQMSTFKELLKII